MDAVIRPVRNMTRMRGSDQVLPKQGPFTGSDVGWSFEEG